MKYESVNLAGSNVNNRKIQSIYWYEGCSELVAKKYSDQWISRLTYIERFLADSFITACQKRLFT